MSNVLAQQVVVIPNLVTFQSTGVAGYQGGQAQLAYLQGTVTEFDGGEGFYQLSDSDFSTPSNPPTVIVDGAGNRWKAANVTLTAAAIIALLTGTPLPIVAGGTGQATASAALDALTVQGANIASAATVNLATATGEFVVVTGSTGPITSLGTATAGIWRFVRFTGTPTLTHNATSLILPGGANITVAAGDTAMFMSLGSGNWQCLFYTEIAGGTVGTLPVNQGGTGVATITNHGVMLGQGTSPIVATAVGATGTVLRGATGADPAFGAVALTTDVTGVLPVANGGTNGATIIAAYDSLTTQGADIPAVAGTTNIGAATGAFVNITGAETITGLGTVAAGTERIVKFTGICVLTHNGTSLILPGSANITTAANDTAAFASLGSGNWLCLWYKRTASAPLIYASAAQSRDNTNTSVALTPANLADAGVSRLLFYIANANMDSTADQVFTKLGTFTNYVIQAAIALNASTSMTTAVGGVYTGASKSGVILIPAAQSYAAATGAATGIGPAITAAARGAIFTDTPILSLTIPQGGTATFQYYFFLGYANWPV